ncbi:MAG: hypothetical protein KC502_18565, partial [Myxococcales bacterium]|nr:hypothetical protein [Myxococcales bacterium]
AQEGQWKWADGTAWKYTNWDNGQPSNSGGGGGQDYLSMRTNGKWNDMAGFNSAPCRVCERVLPKLACDDGNKCTKGEFCTSGKCSGGSLGGCDDGKVCTVDKCDAKTGNCSWGGKTGPCDDGNKCTSGSVCSAGKCKPGTQVACDDKNACTTDKCDPNTGKCVYTTNNDPCSDGNACTKPDNCSAGKCVGVKVTCSDGDPCTTDACDAKTGKCVHNKIAGCAGCKTAADCDDNDPCTDNSCDGSTGKCTQKFNTAPCDTNNPCTYGDKCDGKGKCIEGTSNACDDDNSCTKDSCDKTAGKCVNAPLANGSACSDGKACTSGDSCQSGSCTPKSNQCDLLFNSFDCGKSLSGWFLGSNGGNPPLRWAVDNTPNIAQVGKGCSLNYNDGTDYCRSWGSSCVTPNQSAYTPFINASTASGTPRLSFWTYYDLDGVGQTNTDLPRVRVYAGSQTIHQITLSKDADKMKVWRKIDVPVPNIKGRNNVRIRFYLSPASGGGGNKGKGWFIDDLRVTRSGNQIPENCTDNKDNDGDQKVDCADADCKSEAICTEQCTDGKDNDLDDKIDCKDVDCALAPNCLCASKVCDDKNGCTTDSCDLKTGKCVFAPNQQACSDGDACTTGDSCGAGKCVGQKKTCSDGDPCTADSCSKGTCQNTKIAGCGGCKSDADCADGNACTNNACDSKTGKCAVTNNTKPCDTGDICSYGDTCDGKGVCKVGSAQSCNDGNACTIDSCDAKTGTCSYGSAKDGTSCTDGKACTTGDACKSGSCVPTKADCPLIRYTFDCGTSMSGWYLGSNGGNPALRWAVDNTPANASPSGASGGCNLNYNDGTDYCRPAWGNNCYSPNRYAQTPTFSAASLTGTPVIRFWTYYDVDAGSSDRPRVLVFSGNQVVHNFYLSKSSSNMKKWRKIQYAVPNIKGKSSIRVRFYLAYANGQGNKGKGWFIDDLEISNPGSTGAPLTETCGDGKDNDGNGLTDCSDPVCKGKGSCVESCADGKDNDLDDKIDCADPDCAGDLNCAPPMFADTMDCGSQNWAMSGAKNGVQFALDGTPALVTPVSGKCTLNFNNGKNFCGLQSCSPTSVSNRTAGTATAVKDIDATGYKKLQASYWSAMHGQDPVGSGLYLDMGFLQASTDNFAGCCNGANTSCGWQQVNCNTLGTKTFIAPKDKASWKKWVKATADLSAFAGKKFKLRFRFSSQGSQLNDLPGWFVDDLQLHGSK